MSLPFFTGKPVVPPCALEHGNAAESIFSNPLEYLQHEAILSLAAG